MLALSPLMAPSGHRAIERREGQLLTHSRHFRPPKVYVLGFSPCRVP